MDKNAIIGMILMAAVIFGFMWLQQPSEAELAARKKQAEAAQIDSLKNKNLNGSQIAAVDSMSQSELEDLRGTIQKFGTATTAEGQTSYKLSANGVELQLNGTAITGTVKLPEGTVEASDVLASTSASPAMHNRALAKLREVTNNFSKNGDFAKCVTGKDSIIALENDSLKIEISTKGGVISSATLTKYKAFNAAHVNLFNSGNNSYSFVLNTNSQRFVTKDYYFTPTEKTDSSVVMMLDLGNGSKWGLKYTLSPKDYIVKMEVVQEHMDRIIPANIPSMDFFWEQKIARHEEGKMFEERNSGIYYKFAGGDVEYMSETSNAKKELNDKMKWISFKNQFFSCVLIADKYFTGANMVSAPYEKEDINYQNFLKNVRAESSIEYNSRVTNPASFHFFFGPNLYPLLSSYDHKISPKEDLNLTKLIPLGWKFFRWINTLVIIPIFDWLGHYISNYGIIILLLTIIIKIILFPFTYKSYMSQAKMKILAPDIKAINDKYPGKENAMTRQQKTMALYSSAGASPFSGCLPMLLQMPILFAMFTFFPSCIELRGESFLWVKDLSAPDAIVTWTTQIPFITNYFGNHISLFCLLMTVTNIIYTKINMDSQASSNQMPGMKWMMYMMPLMFLVFFNNYAAGLSYYYFISLLITIGQTYGCRLLVKEDKVRAQMAANAKKPKKKSGFMARLEAAQREQQAAVREQQKKNNNGKGGRR